MPQHGPAPETTTQMRAALIGERLDVRGLGRADLDLADPVVIEPVPGGLLFAFRWGAIVSLGLTPEQERSFVASLDGRITGRLQRLVIETAMLAAGAEQDGIDQNGIIRLRDLAPSRLALVADALAKSAALSHQEAQLSETLDRMEPSIAALRDRGRLALASGGLLRSIGAAISARNRSVTRVQAEDKPDILWDHPGLDRLHLRLVEEFELRERAAALDRKLTLVGETVQTLLSLVEARRSLGLELAITALIAIEVATTIYGLF
ncbi:RMD1 family protein [Elioraea sp.]|uniref:RMD1 family protein n=1 Tax=Elioraea sp. TaxID=2185103 RepID=UPI0025BB674A|nr:RMD1 family protein [Elioraea sp.]